MADILNKPNCGGTTSTFNSGFALCDVIRQAPKGLILLDAGVTFNLASRASVATLVAAIKTATRAPRGGRAFPIFALTGFTDNSTAATKAAVGNLSISEITLQEGIPAFTFEHYKGDLFHQQLSAAENGNLTLLIIDNANVLYGTKTSNGDLAGFSLSEFKALLAKFGTATTNAVYAFSVVLSSITEYKDNLAIVQLDPTIFNLSGIVSVDLNTVGAPPVQVVNVIKVTPVGRGGKNIGINYPSALAVVGAWVATNVQTGANVTITSVTWDSTNGWFVITVDSTAYSALTAGQQISVDLAASAALLALGIDGYESIGTVFLTHP